MDFEKLSDRLKGFLQAAQTIAVRHGNPQIVPEHLLKALLDDPEGLAAGLINRAGGNAKQALQRTDAALTKLPKVSGSGAAQPHMTPALSRDRKSTRLNSSHVEISYAVFCLKK